MGAFQAVRHRAKIFKLHGIEASGSVQRHPDGQMLARALAGNVPRRRFRIRHLAAFRLRHIYKTEICCMSTSMFPADFPRVRE
ncbi:hypothetical protein [Bradyrhizobium sp.]|uniref:hypothetical protein n=1 Tax=Bradyrhizobium sp. TaxID=376 RepID=UPI003C6FA208